ncbi:MAG: hypothetical protein J2P15_24055, partial [Micromonosporaceae bacterium]|nr:hypothetical protein [Micromonosporaceae bacterium]
SRPSPRPATARRSAPRDTGPGTGLRFLRAMVVTVLLGATPLVAAYIGYKFALGEALLPISVDWQSIR